jgi:YHS domain-containing protein
MKKVASILSLAMLAGVTAFVSAEDKTPATSQPATAPATTEAAPANGAINKFCAVETDNKIDPKGKTYTYNGKVIGFCCPDCIDDFKKDPEKYMAKLK